MEEQRAIGEAGRTNAKPTDMFDIFNMRHFVGPNPYLDSEALVFDLALSGSPNPPSIGELRGNVLQRLPSLGGEHFASYAMLFGRTVSEVARLGLNLHMKKWSITEFPEYTRVAVQVLDKDTLWEAIYFTWDWFEALYQPDQQFDYDAGMLRLQEIFSDSVFGGPSTYSLLRAANGMGVPFSYQEHEHLFQYGYGRRQVRGGGTTFDRDSHLDSDFTVRKDDCKAMLNALGFPVPIGSVVYTLEGAIEAAEEVGYPVVTKPLDGHKGKGVTANILNAQELASAFELASTAMGAEGGSDVIVEKYLRGHDVRLLCINGRFAAALMREAAYVIGDGRHNIAELIAIENQSPVRADTAASPLGKIPEDQAMLDTLTAAGLTTRDIPEAGKKIYLRKAANLSQGGVSEDVTDIIHPDNIKVATGIAQQLRLTCFGVDVIAEDISRSWHDKESHFGIIEINAAPGVFMHLNPAKGRSIDVPAKILSGFFRDRKDALIPIITFNTLTVQELERVLAYIKEFDPSHVIGGVCADAKFIDEDEWPLLPEYNDNVRSLLRNPTLDVLIQECRGDLYAREGMYTALTDFLVLDEPTPLQKTMLRVLTSHGVSIVKEGNQVEVSRGGSSFQLTIDTPEAFIELYLAELKRFFGMDKPAITFIHQVAADRVESDHYRSTN